MLKFSLWTENGKLLRIPNVMFSRYDPNQGKVVASRLQIPLKLAYAVTCHRSQGLTLSACVVDCNDMHRPGITQVVTSLYEHVVFLCAAMEPGAQDL